MPNQELKKFRLKYRMTAIPEYRLHRKSPRNHVVVESVCIIEAENVFEARHLLQLSVAPRVPDIREALDLKYFEEGVFKYDRELEHGR